MTPTRDGRVVSPADGLVVSVARVPWPKELAMDEIAGTAGAEVTRIGIFMNVFDVHVNRVPVDGRIPRLAYVPGAFFNATFDKASDQNERQLAATEKPDGQARAFVQTHRSEERSGG